jgi:hypothetical protein
MHYGVNPPGRCTRPQYVAELSHHVLEVQLALHTPKMLWYVDITAL